MRLRGPTYWSCTTYGASGTVESNSSTMARKRFKVADGNTAMSLRELRESVGRTQRDIARQIEMTQPQLSRVEARSDHLTSTLRKYVGALGGRIEIVVHLKNTRVVLRGV